MAAVPLLPCPVRLGVVKDGGPVEQLHKYTMEKNLHKMEKLLKKGVEVDSVNHFDQTPLFCASLLGLTSAVELLLRYGADPNHRCEDRSTPVHAAVFSCKPSLLSGLLDAGGDLRLHDHKGQTPQNWAISGAQEHSPRMLDFLKRCSSHMHSLCQPPQPQDQRRTPTSSKTLVHSPSLLEFLRPGGSDLHVNSKSSTKLSLRDTVQCFGFGKFCIDRTRQPLGLLASLPVILDSELGQADDEPMVSYTCGPFVMTNQLHHPHLLQLMAVSMSTDLQQIGLVFERVHIGSLHTLLHRRRDEFPVLQGEALLSIVLQVCEALLFLHGRGLVMRSLSSHSVQIVHPGVSKVTGLGFTVPSCEKSGPAHLPLPQRLYNWAAPEVIRSRACSGKADLYSLCALIQELYTDEVPWGPVDPRWIKQAVESGQALTADLSVPQPYYQLVRAGLQPRAQDRTSSLQDLRYLLRCDIRELSQKGWGRSGLRAAGWGPDCMQNREQGQTSLPPGYGQEAVRDAEGEPCGRQSDSMLDREIEAQLNQLDQLLEGQDEDEDEDEEVQADSDQSSPQTTFYETVSLDDCHLSIQPPEDSSLDSESESSGPSEEPDWWRWPPELPSRESEHIGAVVLNLKVSQVLLQQSESCLCAVEAALGGGRGGARGRDWDRGVDEVDGMGADEPDGRQGEGLPEALARATGPPSRSYPPYGGLRRGTRTMRGANGAEGRSVWQGRYPLCTGDDIGGEQSECPSIGDEEPTYYSSAREDNFVSMSPRDSQAERSSVSSGMTERRWQQSTSRQGSEDRTYVLSTTSASAGSSPRHPPLGWSDQSTKAKWTNEVSEVVARMTRGNIGVIPCPISSDSDDTDPRRPGGELPVAESSHSSAELEHLLKQFAGIQSVSEDDSDFHTINQTFSMTCGVWEGAGQREEDTSDSDCAKSPVEPSSVFYTPSPELQPHPRGRGSQVGYTFVPQGYSESVAQSDVALALFQMSSVEGDLEVTLEVCQPLAGAARGAMESQNHTVDAILQRSQGPERVESHCPVEEPAMTQCAASQHALFTVASRLQDLAELAELSSITGSPVQHQETLQSSPLSRRSVPCNSTPRSPVESPLLRLLDGCAEGVPTLQSLLDTSPWSNTPSEPPFTTASSGDSTTTDPSASSILQSPTQGATNTKETDATTGPQEFGKRQTTTAPRSPRDKTPAGCSKTKEADSSEGEPHTTGGRVGVVTANRGERPPATEERDSEHSDLCCGDSERTDANTPAVLQCATNTAECLPEGAPVGSVCLDLTDSHSGPGCAVLGTGASGGKHQNRGPFEDDQVVMEETQRAHSTLDEDLQGMLLEMAASRKVAGRPGAIELPKTQDGLRSERTSDSGGDNILDEQEDKLETVNRESWRKPHRVIVLEQTPPKSQIESDQVLDK
ncbi:hypothetical protein AAFF_G00370700 [Aldrovandia affinis]|uniref:Protein kinase domain-containing protein n=1 Tax=Aldrovandia affinis TaxID=143900 RepID=A0AAD7SGT7_9TELE|nr:hypothetical protein AAFF_G00370700 [Aldrovandia affinis]